MNPRSDLELLRAVLESVADGVVVADETGRFLVFNPTAERILGLGPVQGGPRQWVRDYGVFLPDGVTPFPAEQQPLVRAIRGESVDDVELLIRNAGLPGDVLIRVSGRPLRELGGPLRVGVVTFKDVTEVRRREREIAALNRELKERAAELELAYAELESFSYSASHDLRAPLRAIDGFSHALAEDCYGQLDATGADYLRRIRAAAQRMGRLIDALLELARIARTPVRRETVDLSALARTIAAELEKRDPERTVVFAIQDGLCARCEPQLLRAALGNLLDNAWKFTAPHAEARIEFGARSEGDQTIYRVRDDGVGFAMEHAAKLFDPFQRLHRRGEFEGTGIGLASVARIVRRHGGRIWAEAEIGRGAAFSFTLAPPPGGEK